MTSKLSFTVPAGSSAKVHIIDTKMRMCGMPANWLLTPDVEGFATIPPFAAWSFLVESSGGQKVLFDLSFPPDATTYPPPVHDLIKPISFDGERYHVADILRRNGVDPAEIGSVVWSHHHWDHIGDITTFPTSTEIVVGPGFQDAYLPGYPTQPDTWLEERHFEGRTLREINFSQGSPPLQVGAFRAHDFFGDGSFYLLDTPGHDIGHLAGLARTTTNPDTFIFMGGDICHHGGEIRPSPYLHIPTNVNYPVPDLIRGLATPCPGAVEFRELNVKRGRKENEPFYDPVLVVDMAEAVQTIRHSQLADAQTNVFFVFAHDMTISSTVDFFPLSANDWKEKGWRETTLWNFLADLASGAAARDKLLAE